MIRFILLPFTLYFFSTPLSASENLITPGKFVLKSSTPRQLSLPSISHTYDTQKLGSVREPYIPSFILKDYELPKTIANNNEPHWLSSTSYFLAELFVPERAYLDQGIQSYQQKDYPAAISFFEKGVLRNGTFKSDFNLWLAWSHFQLQQFNQSRRYISEIFQRKGSVQHYESHYLSALLEIEQGQFQNAFQNLNELLLNTNFSRWTFKLQYAYLVTLTHLNHWEDILLYLSIIEKKPVSHLKQYHKLLEIKSLALFHLEKTEACFTTLKQLLKTQTGIKQRSYTYRKLAWVAYLENRFKDARLYGGKAQLSAIKNEMNYLRLSVLVKEKNTEEVKEILKGISKDSNFYIFSLFKLQASPKNAPDTLSFFDQNIALMNRFPDLRFYAALTRGNYNFSLQNYKNAQSAYFRALSSDTTNKNYWKAHYNLGLSDMALGEFKKSLSSFSLIQNQVPTSFQNQIKYHRLFNLYALNQYRQFKAEFTSQSIGNFNHLQRIEVLTMAGNMESRRGKKASAADYYFAAWKESQSLPVLKAGIEHLFQLKRYQKIVQRIESIPNLSDEPILIFYIKSLLALGQTQKALKETKKSSFASNPFNALRIEVWFANNLSSSVITFIPPLLNQRPNDRIRQFYYLSLGNAFFNLKSYLKSKTQYYKALNLTSDVTDRSSILFNIAHLSQLMGETSPFQQEVSSILKHQNLTIETRFDLTLLLANSYSKSEHLAESDALLKQYLSRYSYRNAEISLKRAAVLLKQEDLKSCYQISTHPKKGESLYQSIDRHLFLSQCSQQKEEIQLSSQQLKKTLSIEKNYRVGERHYRLGYQFLTLKRKKQALYHIKLARMLSTSSIQKLTAQLLHVNILSQMGNNGLALKTLGEIHRYRSIKKEVEASLLKSDLLKAQKRFSDAEKILLKISYLKTYSPSQKAEVLFKLTVLNRAKGDLIRARSYFKEIIPANLPVIYKQPLKEIEAQLSAETVPVSRETKKKVQP